jgi:two-component system response regulator
MSQIDHGERAGGLNSAPASAEAYQRRTRILVVEDSPVVRLFMKRILGDSELHAEVFEAEDGLEAMSVMQAHAVDMVLCDLNMPNLSGREFCAWIRSRAAWRALPIAICTADHHALHEAQFMGDPYVAILRKPSASQEILAALGRLLVAR